MLIVLLVNFVCVLFDLRFILLVAYFEVCLLIWYFVVVFDGLLVMGLSVGGVSYNFVILCMSGFSCLNRLLMVVVFCLFVVMLGLEFTISLFLVLCGFSWLNCGIW